MPPNDPQWGKKNNEGPPDLDEILRKAQQKIAGLLGFKTRPPGSTGGGGRGMGNAVGGGVIFIILCALSFYIWWRAQKQKVDSNNVNADWDASTNSVVPADVREAAKEAKDKPKDTAAV